jgi:hypothetical protein
MTPMTHRPAVSVALLAVLLVACRTGTPASSDQGPTGTPSSASASIDPTPSDAGPSGGASPSLAPSDEPTDALGPFACELPLEGGGASEVAHLTDIRHAEHRGYDRVVFEFDQGVPAYTIESAQPPFTEDPSGLPLDVEGSSFVRIVFNGGTRQGDDGQSTYDGPLAMHAGLPAVVDIVSGGDFEAVSTWYLGLSETSCLRVFTLDGPSRLVVDVEH